MRSVKLKVKHAKVIPVNEETIGFLQNVSVRCNESSQFRFPAEKDEWEPDKTFCWLPDV